ncbi:MAG: Fic family protein [Alphaproteobacteria bacterium]|nr:Fic family protein [Alphaproteobacteria bacterium]
MLTPPATPGRAGRFVDTTTASERVRAYLPPPLPPDPPLSLADSQALLEAASQALGRLDGLAAVLPDTGLFIYLYVRKEALLSSQIEGTQSSLSDLLLYESDEAPGVPLDDVAEVSTYIAALDHGLARLRDGFPLSLRLIREIHAKLLSTGRGAGKQPGEFRRTQNWIGGTRPGNADFVPPPPAEMAQCLHDLEAFLHADHPHLPVLVRAALAHVQFESIHPFLDGNGRLGRLLITLLLCHEGALTAPILYLSLYFKTHRQAYYARLQAVRETGDWEGWVTFFLEGVRDTARQAADSARRILALLAQDRDRIAGLGRAAASALLLFKHLQRRPILSVPGAAAATALSQPTVATAIRHLQALGIVRETTGRQRHRLYVYDAYLAILNEGTDPLRR